MRPRIEAERELAAMSALLATSGRGWDDKAREEYVDSLQRATEGNAQPQQRPRVKATPGFLAEIQAAGRRAEGK